MKLPLQKTAVSPAPAPEKELDGVNNTLVGRPQEEGIQQQVFSQKETKVIEPVGAATLQKVVSGATDVEPAHNTSKLLCPNKTERLSISPAC